jgi:uncharacterized protein (TIGR02302 family)
MSVVPPDAVPTGERHAARRAERRITLARAAIFWEDVWPRLAAALGILGAYAVLSLFDLWEAVPWQAHVAVFAVAILGTAACLWWRLRGLHWPDHAAGRRRLELKSGFAHRPLELLDDRLAGENPDPATAALWQAHRKRMLARLGQIRVGLPEAGIARRDPWAVRVLLGLLLMVSVVDAGREAPRRLRDGLLPDIGGEARARIALDAWLGPPAYTGLPPILLTRDVLPGSPPGAVVDVPVGSTLLARVHGAKKSPTLVIDGKETSFAPIDAQNFQVSLPVTTGSRIEVRAGRRDLGAWRINVVADQAPTIRFKEAPKPSARAALQIAYEARDDYGLKRVAAEIRRAGSADPFMVELPLNVDRLRDAAESSFHDLTSHPWAGMAVTIRLIAEDSVGQVGQSEPKDLVLPEREFRHPVARAIIEQRKTLVETPARRPVVGTVLGALALAPELYADDTTVHLSLRSARARLADTSEAATKEVLDLLWDVALRVEDGNLSQAEKELRDVEQRLQEALARNAPDAEIEKLIQELKQALDKFMQALAQQAIERAERGEQELEEPDENAEYLTAEDLQRMVDRARDMARQGARDAARDMLSQLQQMLESLKNGKVARAPDQRGQRQQGRRGNQQMQELGEMMRKQQELMDRSFRQNRERQQQGRNQQNGQQGQQQQGQQPGEGDAGEQEALRRQLGEMLRRLQQGGAMPDALRRAEEQMGSARDALRNGEPGQATGPQGQALDLMRQGAQAMQQQMQDQFGNGQDPGGDPNGDRRDRADSSRQEDPLGRDYNSNWDEGLSTKVPTESELQRSREILEELYRRSGERRRPQAERDYLDRLLRRF